MTEEQGSRQAKIESVLRDVVQQGQFGGAVVATEEGLPIAIVNATSIDTKLIGAVAASIRDLAARAQQNLDEIRLRDRHGHLVVSRYFTIAAPQGKYNLLIAVQVPKHKPYRRLLNQAIRRIQQVWLA
ncbi:MAG: roadblock/LC7 domain-containing protein [Chloroflexi bacterium]|nr:MAG: roadblock/LC7 domain-containing protein [Chloroflexota bacterium]